MLRILLCSCTVTVAIAQENASIFFGESGTVGQFEAFNPNLEDDVAAAFIPIGQDWFLFPQSDRGGFHGWLDGGFVGNFGTPASKFNGPYNAIDRANEAMANQVYLIAEQTLPNNGDFGFGARADLLYGEDYLLAVSYGWEVNSGGPSWNSGEYYGLAIPQLYCSIGTEQLSLKMGHFYTIIGYEGVPAVGHFFYTKAYSYQFAGPFTHWGGLATWTPNEFVSWDAGIVNGWNTLSAPYSNANFLGRIRLKNTADTLTTSFAIITGNEATNFDPVYNPSVPLTSANRTRYSMIFEYRPTNHLEYVFHHWLGTQADGLVAGETALWAGIDQYVYYSLSDTWKAGARFEWFQDTNGTRVGLSRPSNPNHVPLPGNFYSLTVGVDWIPTKNFIMRPALRWDFYGGPPSGARLPYDDGVAWNQLMLGFDLIQQF
jgi:hypothetical protein